jgi:hypothetical protein
MAYYFHTSITISLFRNSAYHVARHSFFNIKLQIIISFQCVILLKLRSLTYENIKVLELVLS